MGKVLNLVTGRVTNPGAALTVLTPNQGDSFTVKNAQPNSKVWLESLWAFGGTAGVARIISPLMHDDAQCLRFRYTASDPSELVPDEFEQLLYPQDTLIVAMSGGGAETDTLALLLYYEDLAGGNANLYTWDQIKPRIRNYVAIECDLVSGATIGQYGGAQAINANFDTLKANTDYAILGYQCDTQFTALGITGPGTSNFRVGGPGSTRHEITAGWFVDLARHAGQPMIPVFNSADKANTIIDLVDTAAGAAHNVSILCAQLGSS